MDTGWIKIHRRIRKHWLRKNAEYFSAFIDILILCNHSKQSVLINGEILQCEKGQSIRSLNTWSNEFGNWWTIQKVRTFFKLLEKDNMISIEGLRKTTRLTVCNYISYQNEQHTANTQPTHK